MGDAADRPTAELTAAELTAAELTAAELTAAELTAAELMTPGLMTPELSTVELLALVGRVAGMPAAGGDAECIDRVRHCEALKAALCAVQARAAVQLDESQRRAQVAAGVPAAQLGRGVAEQVALARRVSPWQGRRWLGWAKVVTSELPATFAELAAGRTSEWRTMLVARETAVLSRPDRAVVDAELAP